MDTKKTFKDLMHLATLLFIYLINASVSSPIQQGGATRSQNGIFVVQNSSFSCSDPPSNYAKYPLVSLTNAEKKLLLSSLGGSVNKKLMAVDVDEARRNFKNLLLTSVPIQDTKTKKTKSFDINTLSKIKKDELLQHIRSEPSESSPDIHVKDSLQKNIEDMEVDTIVNYCATRGTPTPDSEYLYTCTMCAATRTMPATYWPQVLNEIVCKSDDSYCFIDNDIPNGKCEERGLYIEMLQKSENKCTLALRDGQTVIIEEWAIHNERLRVGCECYINVHSAFAQFL